MTVLGVSWYAIPRRGAKAVSLLSTLPFEPTPPKPATRIAPVPPKSTILAKPPPPFEVIVAGNPKVQRVADVSAKLDLMVASDLGPVVDELDLLLALR